MTEPNKKPLRDQKKQLNGYARFSGLAIQMFAIIGLGTFAGVKLDEYYPNKHNLFSVSLALISVIASIVFVIRQIISDSKDK